MHRVIILIHIVYFLLSVPSFGQSDATVLFRIQKSEVTVEEFTRLYAKSKSVSEKINFDEFVDQFIIFRLKVEQAMEEGLDTTELFRKELAGYRNQLAQSYLTDNEAVEKVYENIYRRLLTEINAWHILVTCLPDATPEDTLLAYNKSLELRARLIEGEPFESVARGGSDDPSVILNGGNLGYFTAMQMILPFEDVAYSLKKGEISVPVKTPFGYHIIKVNDRRPSQGLVKVAHIMKAVPPGASEDVWNDSYNEIDTIYQKLIAGSSFSEMAKGESDHAESAIKGGEMDWFRTGDIVPEFGNAAFALMRNGDISPPFKTAFGWHIIKRIDRKPIGSFEENRAYIVSRQTNSRVSSLARDSFVNRLKKEYGFNLNNNTLDIIITLTDTAMARSMKKIDASMVPAGRIFSYQGGFLSCHDFVQIIEKNITAFNGSNTETIINSLLKNTIAESLIKYEDSRLESKYPDFRFLIKEFHDGMLLFEVNSREVWNKPFSDTTELQRFYEENIDKYIGKPSADLKVYPAIKPEELNTLRKLVSKYGTRPGGDAKIKSKYYVKYGTSSSIVNRRVFEGDDPELDHMIGKEGIGTAMQDGNMCVILTTRTYQAEPLPVSEVLPEITALYQDSLETNWVAQLKKKYTVWINERVLQEIREKSYEKN